MLQQRPGPAPVEEAVPQRGNWPYRGLLGQFSRATRSVKANIAHDSATSANSIRDGLDMRRLPLHRRRPAASRAVRCASTQGVAPCFFPRRVFYPQATRPKPEPVCTRQWRALPHNDDQEREAGLRRLSPSGKSALCCASPLGLGGGPETIAFKRRSKRSLASSCISKLPSQFPGAARATTNIDPGRR